MRDLFIAGIVMGGEAGYCQQQDFHNLCGSGADLDNVVYELHLQKLYL